MSEEVLALQRQVEQLRAQLDHLQTGGVGYYGSSLAQRDWFSLKRMPEQGLDKGAVRLMIENAHTLDFDHRLNTSSYVNVALDPEEEEIAAMGLRVNLADQTVYPQSYKLHDTALNMIADLWHCPEGPEFDEYNASPTHKHFVLRSCARLPRLASVAAWGKARTRRWCMANGADSHVLDLHELVGES